LRATFATRANEMESAKDFAMKRFPESPRLVQERDDKSNVVAFFGDHDENELLLDPNAVEIKEYTEYATTGPLNPVAEETDDGGDDATWQPHETEQRFTNGNGGRTAPVFVVRNLRHGTNSPRRSFRKGKRR